MGRLHGVSFFLCGRIFAPIQTNIIFVDKKPGEQIGNLGLHLPKNVQLGLLEKEKGMEKCVSLG